MRIQMFTSRTALFLFITFSLACHIGLGQTRYKTDSGLVAFNASTPLEDIQANNQQVNAILKSSGEFAVVLLVREFEFPRKLMQEHFNENYLESDIYPKSYFLGTLQDLDLKSLRQEPREVTISGNLTLHGVTKKVTVSGKLSRKNRNILLSSTFEIQPEDYGVEIPSLVFQKIAQEVTVDFSLLLSPQ